ncbi:hypothetical protein ACFQ60_06220 [Streptomyces zhihengii]
MHSRLCRAAVRAGRGSAPTDVPPARRVPPTGRSSAAMTRYAGSRAVVVGQEPGIALAIAKRLVEGVRRCC